ncbi:hypothetical protein GBA65_17105 [Rubrobacter marinus]|uniref:Recombinase domain-containing protein n=1 Tax=Rubrobacter marinus TaxID=2653852 RepID=A0A6G8Q0E7_9ACTN|nr:hypothetical protein GBA65_17105 [Rubrobacter marinus]
MAIVHRIVRMIGAEGMTINAVCKALEAEGISAPKGGRLWSRQFVRSRILSYVYLPHSFGEISRIESSPQPPQASTRLPPTVSGGTARSVIRRRARSG